MAEISIVDSPTWNSFDVEQTWGGQDISLRQVPAVHDGKIERKRKIWDSRLRKIQGAADKTRETALEALRDIKHWRTNQSSGNVSVRDMKPVVRPNLLLAYFKRCRRAWRAYYDHMLHIFWYHTTDFSWIEKFRCIRSSQNSIHDCGFFSEGVIDNQITYYK